MKVEWKQSKLSEVCETITDGTHKTPTYFEQGTIFLSSKNVTSGKINWNDVKYVDQKQHLDMLKRVAPRVNDILLAKNGTTGVAAIVDRNIIFDIYVSLALLRPSVTIYPPFLLHFVNSPLAKKQFNSRLKGIGVPNLHLEEIREVLIPLPPLPEQKRIVSILDEAFAAISRAKEIAEKNLANAKEVFESYLQNVFMNSGDNATSNQLEDCCELIIDCEHNTAPVCNKNTGYYSIRTPNIGKGTLIYDDANQVTYEIYTKWTRRAIPIAGDLIFAREAPAGNIAIIPPGIKVCLGQRAVLIRTAKNKITPQYLKWLILAPRIQDILLHHSRGATVAHVNMKDIRSLPLNDLPSLAEQSRVVEKLENLESHTKNLESIYQQKLSSLEELKKSLLHQAFTGALTGKSS